MNDLGPRALSLLEAARGDLPRKADKARIKRSVLIRAGAAGVAVSSAVSTSSAGTGTALAVASTKIGVLAIVTSLALGGSAGVGVIMWRERPPRVAAVATTRNQASVESDQAPSPTAAIGEPVKSTPSREEGQSDRVPAVQRRIPAAAPPASATAPASGLEAHRTLEAELPLLQRAQEALRAGQPALALSLLDEHAKRFPNGMLAEEQRAAHAIALCQTKAEAAGRAEADAFVRAEPSSPLVERVRRACGR